ncbi:MAG: peptidoglycan-binding protein [Acidobacteriota bacterium]
MPFHVVVQGETLLGLASANGLDSWEDIVNAPENASVKDTLTDPGIVQGGLSLFIPSKTMKQKPSAVDALHPFTIKRPTAWLRLALKDSDGTALAGKAFQLTVGGKSFAGTVAADGVLEQAVPIDVTSGSLKVWITDAELEEWQLKIGWMDPISTITGVQARLNNLGFDCGDADGVLDDATTWAIKAFQSRVGLEPTGTLDDALREKIASYYDAATDETTLDVEPEAAEDEA